MKDKTPSDRFSHCFADACYGTATLGERGQIVIPAEARAQMDLHPGDKILIVRHPVHKGLMLTKLEAIREFLDQFNEELARLEQQQLKEKEEEN